MVGLTSGDSNVKALKGRAVGRWPEILSRLGSAPAESLDGRHHPCPKCGGKDRFRMIDREAGALVCNQCFNEGNGDGIAALQWLCDWSLQSAVANLTDYLGNGPETVAQPDVKGESKIVAAYDYRDEQGELLYQVVRVDPKDFRQRRPKPGGGWEWTVKGVRKVPYRLKELLAADPSRTVFIVEGEKDADRAAENGIVATTCVMGAGKWRSEYSEHFRNRRVCIFGQRNPRQRRARARTCYPSGQIAV